MWRGLALALMLVPSPLGVPLAVLGERLFHDPTLSAGRTLSCASCHDPARGFAGDDAPSLAAAGSLRHWGRDGRHTRLEDAIRAPLTDPAEMANPDPPALAVPALAAYIATLDTPTRYDAFRGGRADLTPAETRGLRLFAVSGCSGCHTGPQLTDQRFHNLGLSAFGELSQDLGRYGVTKKPSDAGRFRTPSLRHVGQTGPYMHTGHFRTLEGIVRFYAQGGGKVWARNAAEAARPLYAEAARVSPLIRRLTLSESDIADLVAFLNTL